MGSSTSKSLTSLGYHDTHTQTLTPAPGSLLEEDSGEDTGITSDEGEGQKKQDAVKKANKEKDAEAEKAKIKEYDDLSLKVDDIWLEVKKSLKDPVNLEPVERKGWETVRIFVSSTFRDFHTERDILVKKVRTFWIYSELEIRKCNMVLQQI